ncbi:dephospho-kinase [Stylonychia lemnae]|uniref:Dephospho-kinase n=1 Tax=Stylonychia lemnae TaxID=5949 RepID=A0A078AVH7_STYLE|nr:dephospho-kinase [Stylonychia lemnae]|eukprot:CDW86370.1 dephospho-kinase [Stylonychia lemnae]
MSLTSKKLFKIGITGGIGSGKSKLLEYLSTIPRIYTINLDVYGHEIYKLNPLVLRNLSTMFGKEVLNYDKSQQPMRDDILGINRLELGKQAFKNEYNLNALKSLVSPEIKRLLKESISEVENRFQDQYDVIAVEGAVLIEQKTFVMFDELWVTTLDKHDAVKRVMKRNPELSEKNINASPSKSHLSSPIKNSNAMVNKIFPLNKQVILSCRKLETGPLENYIHMATLIHKINLLLLEYENIKQLRSILQIVFSKQLLNSIIDFCMNTDHFAQFGIRLLEIMSLEFALVIAKSDAVSVIFGLLRTNDYETVVQCLSFLRVLISNSIVNEKIKASDILNKKLLVLVMKTVQKQPEIEYLACLVDIVNLVVNDKELRSQILTTVLKEDENQNIKIDYLKFLKTIESKPEIKSIRDLSKKISRQVKELEIWNNSVSK